MATAQPDGGKLARLKERAKATRKGEEKKHLHAVNWAVGDAEHPSNKRSRASDHVPAPGSRLLGFSRVEFPRKTGWRGMMQPWGQRHGQLLQGTNQARMRKSWGKKIRGAGKKGEAVLSLNSERRIKKRTKKNKKSSQIGRTSALHPSALTAQRRGPERRTNTDIADAAPERKPFFTIGPSSPMKELEKVFQVLRGMLSTSTAALSAPRPKVEILIVPRETKEAAEIKTRGMEINVQRNSQRE